MEKLKVLTKKAFSLFLAFLIAISGGTVGFAQLLVSSQSPAAFSPSSLISLPLDLGKIADSFSPSRNQSDPLIIHIEEAHAHFGIQTKISEILDYLNRQYGVRTIFVEGASGKMDTELFRIFPDHSLNVEAARHWLREGQFSGAELFAIEQGSRVGIEGVEDSDLYEEDLELFLSIAKKIEIIGPILKEWKSHLRRLNKQAYSGDLKILIEARENFRSGKTGLSEYLHFLKKLISKSRLSTSSLDRLFQLEKALGEISAQKWFQEWSKILDLIRRNVPENASAKKFLIENWLSLKDPAKQGISFQDPKTFFEIFLSASERYGFDLSQFYQLPFAARVSVLRAELSETRVIEEVHGLEITLAQRMAKTRLERGLFESNQILAELEKLFHLELERKEWQKIHRNPTQWTPSSFRKQLEMLEKEVTKYPKPFGDISDASFFEVMKFYDLAFRREKVLVRNTLERMRALKESRVCLITGGFHTEGVREALKKEKIPYLSISPAVFNTEEKSRYLEVMLNQNGISRADMLAVPSRFDPKRRDILREIVAATLGMYPANGTSDGRSLGDETKSGLDQSIRPAIWGLDAAGVGVTTSALLSSRGFSVALWDSPGRLEQVKTKNHEKDRPPLLKSGFDSGKIIERPIELPAEDATEEKKEAKAEEEQKRIVEEHSVIIINADPFQSETKTGPVRQIKDRSVGFGKALLAFREKERMLNQLPSHRIFVIRAHVHPLDTERIMEKIFTHSNFDTNFSVVYVPEAARIGRQIEDMSKQPVILGFPNLSRIVSEAHSDKYVLMTRLLRAQMAATDILKSLFVPEGNDRLSIVDSRSAELQYFYLQELIFGKILFLSSAAPLLEALGGNIDDVRRGMIADPRIGAKDPKDEYSAVTFGIGGQARVLLQEGSETLKQMNESLIQYFQKLIERVMTKKFGKSDFSTQTFAILGAAFKAESASFLESPTLDLVKWLVTEKKARKIILSDSVVGEVELKGWVEKMKRSESSKERDAFRDTDFEFYSDPLKAMVLADVSILATDHREFKELDPAKISEALRSRQSQEKPRPLFDGRNAFDPLKMERAGINYVSFGRPAVGPDLGSIAKREAIKHAQFDSAFMPDKVAVIGTGPVGLVTGAALAEIGEEFEKSGGGKITVTNLDINGDRIRGLRRTPIELPVYEPGLEELVKKHRDQGRLRFIQSRTSSFVKASVSEKQLAKQKKPQERKKTALALKTLREAQVVYIAVDTPPLPGNQGANLKSLLGATRNIGFAIQKNKRGSNPPLAPKVIVVKSTIPSNAFDKMKDVLEREYGLEEGQDFDLVSNPEFLVEGDALRGALKPDRMVIGAESEHAAKVLIALWKPLQHRHPHEVMVMDRISATLTKYHANGLMASQISTANRWAKRAEELEASSTEITKMVKRDPRVSPRAPLEPGGGFGGSCFRKDIEALAHLHEEVEGSTFKMLQETLEVNEEAPRDVVEKIKAALQAPDRKDIPSLKGKRVTVLGLAFKKDTDDTRETRSAPVVAGLLENGATVVVHDPLEKSWQNFRIDLARYLVEDHKKKFPVLEKKNDELQELLNKGNFQAILDEFCKDRLFFIPSIQEALDGSHGLIIMTDWQVYREMNLDEVTQGMILGIVPGNGKTARIVIDIRRMLVGRHHQFKGPFYIVTKGEVPETILPPSSLGETEKGIERDEHGTKNTVASSLGLAISSQARRTVRRWLEETQMPGIPRLGRGSFPIESIESQRSQRFRISA